MDDLIIVVSGFVHASNLRLADMYVMQLISDGL